MKVKKSSLKKLKRDSRGGRAKSVVRWDVVSMRMEDLEDLSKEARNKWILQSIICSWLTTLLSNCVDCLLPRDLRISAPSSRTMTFTLTQLKLEEIKTRLRPERAQSFSRMKRSAKELSERSRARILLIVGSNSIRSRSRTTSSSSRCSKCARLPSWVVIWMSPT